MTRGRPELLQPGPGCNLQDWDTGHFQGLVSQRSQGQGVGSTNTSPTSTLFSGKRESKLPRVHLALPIGPQKTGEASQMSKP